MPRRNKMRRAIKRGRPGLEQLTISGQDLVNLGYSASFSFNAFQVRPSLFNRAVIVAGLFEEYRLDKLSVKALPSCTSPVTFGWLPGQTAVSPSGLDYSYVLQTNPNTIWFPNQTVPVTMKVGKRQVGQQLNWLLTTGANNQAGYLMIGGPTSTAVSCLARVSWTMTFRGPVGNGKIFSPGTDERYITVDQTLEEECKSEVDVESFTPRPPSTSNLPPGLAKLSSPATRTLLVRK